MKRDEKKVKKLLSISSTLNNLIETEAILIGTTSTQLIRTAILSWICRNHQVRIPTMYTKEGKNEVIQNQTIELYKRLFRDENLTNPEKITPETRREIYYKVYAIALEELDEALKKLR